LIWSNPAGAAVGNDARIRARRCAARDTSKNDNEEEEEEEEEETATAHPRSTQEP
jgi:hypothetical protein